LGHLAKPTRWCPETFAWLSRPSRGLREKSHATHGVGATAIVRCTRPTSTHCVSGAARACCYQRAHVVPTSSVADIPWRDETKFLAKASPIQGCHAPRAGT